MYNLFTEQWKKHVIPKGQTVPAERYCGCAVSIGSDVYVFGGYVFSKDCTTNALWKLATNPQKSFAWNEIVMTNKEKTPSPRTDHTGWEHGGKLWTFGGWGSSPAGFLHEYGNFAHGCNNQLLCFNPSNEEWTNQQCHGMVPEPCGKFTTTKGQDKVWLCRGSHNINIFHDLYELNMHSCTWTLIQTQQTIQIIPQARVAGTLSKISDDKLTLHGGTSSIKRLKDTWILDLKKRTWRSYTSGTNIPRSNHTASPGINNSVVIIGGLVGNYAMDRHQSMCTTTFHVLTEPKSLKQLAMQKIYKHHTDLPWKNLPRKLTVLLDIQTEEDANNEASN